jgi:hypothetical protein
MKGGVRNNSGVGQQDTMLKEEEET